MTAFLYELITCVLLSLSAVLTGHTLFFSAAIPVSLLSFTLISSVLSVLFFRLKLRGRGMFLGIAAVLTAGMILAAAPGERIALIRQYLWTVPVLLVCILSVLFEQGAKRFRILRVFLFILPLTALLYCLFARIAAEKITVLVNYACSVSAAVLLIQEGWTKEGDVNPMAHYVFITPFLLALFLVLALLKVPETPYDWKLVKDFAREMRLFYERIRSALDEGRDWDEGEAEIGFAETPRFYGEISASDAYIVMELSDGAPSGTRILLSGKSLDAFTGRNWVKTDDTADDYMMHDLLETLSAVIRYDPGHIGRYVQSRGFEAEYKGIRSVHLFKPLKSIPKIRETSVVQKGGDLLFDRKKGRNYSINYYRLNRSFEGFSDLLMQKDLASLTDEESFEKAKSMLSRYDVSGYDLSSLSAYRKKMRERYGEKPVLSERMSELLEKELEGAETDYEKLKRIEALLSAMTYTDSPGELPETVIDAASFLDDLFFGTQSGYCTHFATAFVLLARSQGIPARYQSGYYFTAGKKETLVMSYEAHAWPEAYIEGFGWLDFEPTPGYLPVSGWKVTMSEEEKEKPVYTLALEEEEEEEETETAQGETAEVQERTSGSRKLPLLLAVLFLAGYISVFFLIRKLRYQRMTDRQKIQSLFSRSLRILRHMGFRMEKGETLAEFAERAGNAIGKETLSFIGVYEEILYGERDVSEEDTGIFEDAVRSLFRVRMEQWKKAGLRRKKKESGTG